MSRLSLSGRLPQLILLTLLPLASPWPVTTSSAADAAYRLAVVADRDSAIYEVGEQAKFLVTLHKGDQSVTTGTVSYIVDDFIPARSANRELPRGEWKLGEPSQIAVQVSTPGFVRCRVTYHSPENKTFTAVAGAGFSPTKIGQSLPVPDDFDEFWASQKADLAKIPAKATLTSVDSSDQNVDCFDVQVACEGDAPVSGYFAKPKQAKPKSLPAILWVHGAGVRSSSMANAVKGATAGMLSMDINAHGIANGKPAQFYQDLTKGRLLNYSHAGKQDRHTSYFRGMFLRLVRAIDFLTDQPQWDGKTVVVIGHSQGGGQALAAGGLDRRVTLIAAGVPAICDHSGRAAGRINGWPKLVPQGSDGKPSPTILEASRYVDAVNLASRCQADAIMSVGFVDATCPPSSCYAAFNQLTGEKQMIDEPLMAHAAPRHIQEAFFQRVLEHIQRKPTTD